MVPPLGSSNPPIIRSVVVLPHPEGPSREKNSPSAIVKETPSTATTSLKCFVTSWRRTSDMICSSSAGSGVVEGLVANVVRVGVPPRLGVHLRIDMDVLRLAEVVEPLGPELATPARRLHPA